MENFDDWFLFFCKRGKQKRNRRGFYWGVPSHTSNKWDWATPFLELYQKKRASDKGEALMGAIFRADSFEHFTLRAVNIITQEAMQELFDGLLGNYSWRSYLPTMVGSSKEEWLALGDWQDKDLMKQSAAITLRYAEGKSGMSRRIKVKLSRVQEILRIGKIDMFDDVTDAQWKTMIDEASVNLEVLSVKAQWRNPDVLEQTREFASQGRTTSCPMPSREFTLPQHPVMASNTVPCSSKAPAAWMPKQEARR